MVSFELENDEAIALMQCAHVGAQAATALLGANARPMLPIFEKIQKQFNEQAPPRAGGNGATANAAVDTR